MAQSATPYATASYFEDERFRHTHGIDSAVKDEGLVAILGVPLALGGDVLGVLYAANRTARPFAREEVSLLVSLAAHAAIAIDSARLLEETQRALADLERAHELVAAHSRSVERAADAHDRFADLVLRGGDVDDVAAAVAEVLGAPVLVLDDEGQLMACSPGAPTSERGRRRRPAAAALGGGARGRAGRRPHRAVRAGVAGAGTGRAAPGWETSSWSDTTPSRTPTSASWSARLSSRRCSWCSGVRRPRPSSAWRASCSPTWSSRPTAHRSRCSNGPSCWASTSPAGCRSSSRAARPSCGTGSLPRPRTWPRPGTGSLRATVTTSTCSCRSATPRSPAGSPPTVARELAAACGAAVTCGGAGPIAGGRLDVLPATHGEAARTVDTLLALGRAGEGADAAQLGFVGFVLGGHRDVAQFVHEQLGALVDYDERRRTELVATLAAYFGAGQSPARASQQLHVHVNTVTQRLDRIGQLLGAGWNEPERALELQVALRLHRVLP